MAINHVSSLLNCPEEANWRRREDAQAFFDARVQVGQLFACCLQVDLALGAEFAADFVFELLVDAWVAEEVGGESGER